jgi:ABC-2 type transport system ATP-binding protein
MDQVISFRSAVALAGRFPVLAGVDLDVAHGDVVLLRGANGAGKTSLLRACAGLLRVVGGEASVLGQDLVRDQRGVRRRVGLLGHQSGLYQEMSPAENLRFALRAARVPVSQAAPALEKLGITGRLVTTPVGNLSAGQRRRVALSVLVARDPELWLLDEPHAGLDADHRDLLDGLISGAAARGRTVVLASHEADRAGGLARTVVTLAGGVVTSVDTPAGPAGRSSGTVGGADQAGETGKAGKADTGVPAEAVISVVA